jgi:WD40 repeat protein
MEVGLRRRESRLEEREVVGSGVGYLMQRWRRGDVFTRLRNDGRYALVASERGKDSFDSPGNVYLISVDNLRTKELQPGDQAKGRRLEFMGFSLSGKEILVARQFYLDIFDLDGNRTRSVQLESHATPTHLIAGMFGSYVLVGDTVGHVMLADTLSGNRPQLEGGRYPDAALSIESKPDGNRAIVIFESGKAQLVVIDDPSSPAEFGLGTNGTMHAAFSPRPRADRFLTTSHAGRIDVWQLTNGIPAQVVSFNHGKTPISLASFSSNGTHVISLGDDNTYKVWDIASRALLASYGPITIGDR